MLLQKLKVVMMLLLVVAIGGGAGVFYRLLPVAPAVPPQPPGNVENSAGKDKESEPAPIAPGTISLPSSPMPRQALVHLDKGQLVVRTLDVTYEPTSVRFQGKVHAGLQKSEIIRTRHFDLELVKAYDMKGKHIDAKELPNLVKKELVVLISSDPRAADPLNLRLFKDGTLLFIFPSASGGAVPYGVGGLPALPETMVPGGIPGRPDPEIPAYRVPQDGPTPPPSGKTKGH
jgi:hypothetical protein